MLELTSYGLTGVVAILVVAFCVAYSDDLAPAKEKCSFDPVSNAHLPGSPMPAETGAVAVCSDRTQHAQAPEGAVHG